MSWQSAHPVLTKVNSHWPAGCKEDCASCFSETFCTQCHLGHFLFRGKCENSCPNGLTPNAALRECSGETLCSTVACYFVCMLYWNEVFHDVRELEYNIRCLCLSVSECSIGCEVCVRRNTCVRCRADLYFLHGQCHLTCPRGFEPDVQLMQCIPQGERNSLLPHSWNVKYNSSSFQHHINASFQYRSLCMCISAIPHFCFLLAVSLSLISLLIVDCEVGEWTDWDQCVRRRSTRPYRRGQEKRTRRVLRPPSVYGVPCPHLSEIRKCVIKKRPKTPSRL